MNNIKIVGVPEHFNYPWHLCFENDEFLKSGVDLHWEDVPEGTGKMCEMLRSGNADMAVILTEGIVRDIANGNPSKIVQIYVESPLIWGIHVASNSTYYDLSQLRTAKVAISRPGSGSQLMAYVNAKNLRWPTDELKFEIVNTIDGAVNALTAGTADYFMWERFMTKPLVDTGTFKHIANCPTPWPCFVIAVADDLLQKDPKGVRKVLDVINAKTMDFKSIPNIDLLLAETFKQNRDDISEWMRLTTWSQKQFAEDMLNKVQNELLDLRLIDKKATFTQIVKDV